MSETPDTTRAETPVPATSRRAGWDFTLMMITVGLLAALGVVSIIGTAYVWWAERGTPGWSSGPGYSAYVGVMNAIAAPIVAAIVVAIGLCVPKRVFSRRVLVWVSAGMLALGLAVGLATGSLGDGLTAYLLAAGALQVVVVVMTVAGAGGLEYLSQGRRKLGSALLHLGFIVFALVVVALQSSGWMLPVFFLSALLLAGGSALSFYARG